MDQTITRFDRGSHKAYDCGASALYYENNNINLPMNVRKNFEALKQEFPDATLILEGGSDLSWEAPLKARQGTDKKPNYAVAIPRGIVEALEGLEPGMMIKLEGLVTGQSHEEWLNSSH